MLNIFMLFFVGYPQKGGVVSRGFCNHELIEAMRDEVKAMKMMKINRLDRFALFSALYKAHRRTLPDPDRVSQTPLLGDADFPKGPKFEKIQDLRCGRLFWYKISAFSQVSRPDF